MQTAYKNKPLVIKPIIYLPMDQFLIFNEKGDFMDFLKLNKEFLILQEKLDNYTQQEKKIKDTLKKIEKQIIKLEEKKNKETLEIDKMVIDLQIVLKKEILLFLKDLGLEQ